MASNDSLSFNWKIFSIIFGCVFTITVTLFSIAHNNLIAADKVCQNKLKQTEEKINTNCVSVGIHRAKIEHLEHMENKQTEQLNNIENLLTRTTTIVERLEKKIDNNYK